MLKYYFFQDKISNELMRCYINEVNEIKEKIFKLVLNYRFNLELLLDIVNFEFSVDEKSLKFIERIMNTRKCLTFYYCKKYYKKYYINISKKRSVSNADNFYYYFGNNIKLCMYYYSKLSKNIREIIYEKLPDNVKVLSNFLKDKHDIIIISAIRYSNVYFNIDSTFVYQHDPNFNRVISQEELESKKIRYASSKLYMKILHIKYLKLSFFYSCFNAKYVNNLKIYYWSLFEIDNNIAPCILLDLIVTYKHEYDSKLLNSMIKHNLMYHFEGEVENKRRRIMNDLLELIPKVSNNYLMKYTSNSNDINNPILINFLQDFDICKNKIRIINSNNGCISYSYGLKYNYESFEADRLVFVKKKYIRCKEILKTL